MCNTGNITSTLLFAQVKNSRMTTPKHVRVDYDGEPISVRVSRMNQMLVGKSGGEPGLEREGLLDALFTLYEECNTKHLMKNEYIKAFVEKSK